MSRPDAIDAMKFFSERESAGEALSMVGGRYPGGVVRVAFPTQRESFFVHQQTHEAAA